MSSPTNSIQSLISNPLEPIHRLDTIERTAKVIIRHWTRRLEIDKWEGEPEFESAQPYLMWVAFNTLSDEDFTKTLSQGRTVVSEVYNRVSAVRDFVKTKVTLQFYNETSIDQTLMREQIEAIHTALQICDELKDLGGRVIHALQEEVGQRKGFMESIIAANAVLVAMAEKQMKFCLADIKQEVDSLSSISKQVSDALSSSDAIKQHLLRMESSIRLIVNERNNNYQSQGSGSPAGSGSSSRPSSRESSPSRDFSEEDLLTTEESESSEAFQSWASGDETLGNISGVNFEGL